MLENKRPMPKRQTILVKEKRIKTLQYTWRLGVKALH